MVRRHHAARIAFGLAGRVAHGLGEQLGHVFAKVPQRAVFLLLTSLDK